MNLLPQADAQNPSHGFCYIQAHIQARSVSVFLISIGKDHKPWCIRQTP